MSTPAPPASARPTAPPPPRGITPGRLVTGSLLILLGIGWLLEALDLAEVRWQTALAAAVAVIGLVILLSARRGGADGLIGLGVVLSIALVLTATLPGFPVDLSAGERRHAPAELGPDPSWSLGAGSLELDLRDTALSPGTSTVTASVGMGELVVLVPDGLALTVEASVGAGEITALGQTSGGLGRTLSASDGTGDQRLVLELSAGLGNIEVRR